MTNRKGHRKGKIEANYDRMMAARRKILNAYYRWCEVKQPALNRDKVEDIFRNQRGWYVFTHESGQVCMVSGEELEEY